MPSRRLLVPGPPEMEVTKMRMKTRLRALEKKFEAAKDIPSAILAFGPDDTPEYREALIKAKEKELFKAQGSIGRPIVILDD